GHTVVGVEGGGGHRDVAIGDVADEVGAGDERAVPVVTRGQPLQVPACVLLDGPHDQSDEGLVEVGIGGAEFSHEVPSLWGQPPDWISCIARTQSGSCLARSSFSCCVVFSDRGMSPAPTDRPAPLASITPLRVVAGGGARRSFRPARRASSMAVSSAGSFPSCSAANGYLTARVSTMRA